MKTERFHNIMSRGLGQAARAIGDDYDVYRSRGAFNPLASENRIMRMPVSFGSGPVGIKLPRQYSGALPASFDAVSSMVGDYFRGPRGVLFVAALPVMRQPACILTNASIDVLRAGGAIAAGLNEYGGSTETTLALILGDWPVRFAAGGGSGAGSLPADGGQTGWSVVIPPTPSAILASDLLQDSEGRRYVVKVAERTDLGWCLSVKGTEV